MVLELWGIKMGTTELMRKVKVIQFIILQVMGYAMILYLFINKSVTLL